MGAVVVVEALAIVLLGVLVVGLLRSHGEILRRLHELGAGLDDEAAVPSLAQATAGGAQRAHDVAGLLPDGSSAAVAVVGAAHDTVLAFLSTTCLSCETFWDAFAGPFTLPTEARLVVVVQEGDSVSRVRRLAPDDVLVVRSDAAWAEYDVPGSPHFVHVDRRGLVTGEGTADTWEQVLDLLQHAAGRGEDPRDNADRIDRELLASGIGPGHASLYTSLDAAPEDRE